MVVYTLDMRAIQRLETLIGMFGVSSRAGFRHLLI